MGSKDKAWFLLPDKNEHWLFKYARLNKQVATGEHWAEKIAAEIAELIGVAHCLVELAEFEGRMGSLSRRFRELSQPGMELIHGNDLLAGLVLGYDRNKRFHQSDHTLENILAAIAKVIPEGNEREVAFRQLAGFVVLDALILNTDRHHENWALLRENLPSGVIRHRVAPSFDHASSLGRELPKEKLETWEEEDWRAKWYALRAPGGIYLKKDQKKGENPLRLAEVALRWRPQHVRPWLDTLRGLNPAQLSDIVERIPVMVISEQSRRFCTALLRFTLEYLQKLK